MDIHDLEKVGRSYRSPPQVLVPVLAGDKADELDTGPKRLLDGSISQRI